MDLRDSKLQTTPVTSEARGRESWGGEEEKESVAVEGADRAKGNRSTYPHLHVFLSRVWRKRIGEYVSMSPEHNHTTGRPMIGAQATARRCRRERGGGRTSLLMHSWKEHGEAQ